MIMGSIRNNWKSIKSILIWLIAYFIREAFIPLAKKLGIAHTLPLRWFSSLFSFLLLQELLRLQAYCCFSTSEQTSWFHHHHGSPSKCSCWWRPGFPAMSVPRSRWSYHWCSLGQCSSTASPGHDRHRLINCCKDRQIFSNSISNS